jgi:hypothetical protein
MVKVGSHLWAIALLRKEDSECWMSKRSGKSKSFVTALRTSRIQNDSPA